MDEHSSEGYRGDLMIRQLAENNNRITSNEQSVAESLLNKQITSPDIGVIKSAQNLEWFIRR